MKFKAFLSLAILLIAVSSQMQLAAQDAPQVQCAIANIEMDDQSTVDGSQMVGKLLDKVQGLNDYQYDCSQVSWRTGKPKEAAAKFYFKKPGMIRIEVVSQDFRNGSIIIKQADGTIKAAGGGLLHAMQMTLDENSRMLRLPSGTSAVKSDFASLISGLQSKLANGAVCKASKAAIPANTLRGDGSVVVIDVFEGPDKSIRTERLLVNPHTFIPVEWAYFSAGKILSTVAFKNLVVNKGVSDSNFKL
jgi:outer membrane lipoprotein-sorting protein